MFIEELTWVEVRDAVAGGATTAIVATGGVEMNGPFVVTGKHNYVVRAVAERVARRLGDALVSPIIAFVPEGAIDPPSGHMRFAGTISVREATFEALLTDVVASLAQHGFRDIVLIGDSGGNQAGMRRVAARFRHERSRAHYVGEYYETDRWSYHRLKSLGIHQQPDVQSAARAGVHSDYHYEAILAWIDPELVRARARREAGMLSINGVALDPMTRTRRIGEALIDYRADLTVEAIRRAIAR